MDSYLENLSEANVEEEEEWEEERTEEESVEEESILTEYDPDTFISGAVTSPEGSIPFDFLDFLHSFGYNCKKYFNLCACDETVVCWSAGSIITFMDVVTKQLWFRRSTTGGTVGCITSYRQDPNYRIAVGEDRENENEPVIILYTWPQMDMDAVLREGTANAYSIMDFSPDGELLASVGKEPDYNLTIWTWKRHKILLRISAFTFDVNAVFFSPYCPGQLTTAGAAHIKFWKMAQTFTGLKLQGELGRFGKTEICDVLGVYPMPDEKVLSGCEWGNVLVWEAGLVKVEVTQRGRKRCHDAPIIQFMLSEAGDEVTTIARDGCVRAWYWDTVEQADPPEDDPYVELNPVAETCVPGCQIMCLKHQKDMFWYAQDGNGGVWTVELEIDKIQCDHKKVITTHAGGVIALTTLRSHPILLTVGEDGCLLAYSTDTYELLARYEFPTALTCMLYPSIEVDPSSRILMIGAADGIMRTLLVHPDVLLSSEAVLEVRINSALTIHSDGSEHSDAIDLISHLKPHSQAITQISINYQNTLLVTCGEDCTIFIYQLILEAPFRLERIGFIETPNKISFMTWKPEEETVLLLCGQVGLVMETVLPDIGVRDYTEITTFKLDFKSYTEVLVKKHYMRHRPFPQEEDLASLDEEALKAQGESNKEDEEEEYIGEIQLIESESMLGTTITYAEYCSEGIWVVQRGTGALLLVQPGVQKILKYAPFPGAWCEDISCLRFVCDNQYLIVGTNTGYIRMVKMPTEEEDLPECHYMKWMLASQNLLKKLKGRRLAKEETQPTPRIDFIDTYYLPMHDHYTGLITCIDISADGKRLYTCGMDGNIFCYAINFELPLKEPLPKRKPPSMGAVKKVKEPSSVETELMSHEQLKQKEEYDKMMAIANAHKKKVRDMLVELTTEYSKLIKANRLLPITQQIDVTLDPRPLVIQEKELEEAKALTKRKLAHQLEASEMALQKMYNRNIIMLDVMPFIVMSIRDPTVLIRPFRQKNLSKEFMDQFNEVHEKMAEAALRGRRTEAAARKMTARRQSWGPPRMASFLLGMPPKAPHPLKKALLNYRQRLYRHHVQFIEWQEHLSRKPDPHALPPGAAEALKQAEGTIGNRFLKTKPDYVAPPGHNTQLRICLTRKEIYDIKRAFNEKVLELRDHKVKLINEMKSIGERLAEIRVEIPPKLVKPPPPVPTIDQDLEFPEANLEIKAIVIPSTEPAHRKKSVDPSKKLSSIYPVARIRHPRVTRFVPLIDIKPLAVSWDILKTRPEVENTPIEIEIRDRRIQRHLYEQDMLIADAEVSIMKFENRLVQLQKERIRVQEKNQLLELHLRQLHREMNVLNKFEAHEDRLAGRVYDKLMQVRGVQDQIHDCEQRIIEHKNEKEELGLTCEDLQIQFKKLVQDNKFADFLRRIFKKKYRPPKDHDDDDDDESESDSSSSSEDEDEGSLDSRDIGPIRLDPTICPPGCEQDIFDQTYDLRNTRHKHEQQMIEQDRLVDVLRRDIDAHNKVKRKLTIQLQKRKEDLKEFMMEKQNCLNEVTQVVVLRYDQIRARCLRNCTGPDGLSKSVVFPEKMLQQLRSRVTELQQEIQQQKQRQKINRTHLHRMNIDLKAMEANAEELRAEMRDVLTKKLGKPRKVDKTLDDLLRQMARRHKFSATMGFIPEIMQQTRNWKKRFNDLEKKYYSSLQVQAEKLRLAAALQADIFPHKETTDLKKVGLYTPDQYRRDVVRLRIVRSQQLHHLKLLTEDIANLQCKSHSKWDMGERRAPTTQPRSNIDIKLPHRKFYKPKRYFPLTPLGSTTQLKYEVNQTTLLFDALDAMKKDRDEAPRLLRDITAELPDVYSGKKSRFEVIDLVMKRWLQKPGDDKEGYKKEVSAFDAIATLLEKLVVNYTELDEESRDPSEVRIVNQLEEALRDVADEKQPLHERLAPALAAILLSSNFEELDSDEIMTSLVHSLVNENYPVSVESLDKIKFEDVMADIRECGVTDPPEELDDIVMLAIQSLRAQLLSEDEAQEIQDEIDKQMQLDLGSVSSVETIRSKK